MKKRRIRKNIDAKTTYIYHDEPLETNHRKVVELAVASGGNPALTMFFRMNAAMREPKRADCKVYNAEGKLVAVIDGETRERREVE